MEEYINEVAIIFIAKKSSTEEVELIPQTVIDGFYDFSNEKFIDLNGREYNHFINIDVDDDIYTCFGFNYSLKNYLVKFPECSYNTIFKTIIEELKKYTFICRTNNAITNVEITNILTGEVVNITDNLCDELNNMIFKTPEIESVLEKNDSSLVQSSYPIDYPLGESKQESNKIDTVGLYKKLTDYIIGQDEALKTIVGTIWKNYNSDSSATNILIAGPTGVGKTETARIISSHINVPIITVGANSFSQVGYVGDNTKDILKNLLSVAGGNVAKAKEELSFLTN